jgi:hypothetical protein
VALEAKVSASKASGAPGSPRAILAPGLTACSLGTLRSGRFSCHFRLFSELHPHEPIGSGQERRLSRVTRRSGDWWVIPIPCRGILIPAQMCYVGRQGRTYDLRNMGANELIGSHRRLLNPTPDWRCVNARWLTSLAEWVAATQGKRQGGVTVAKFHPVTNPTPKARLQAKQAKFLTALVRARWRPRSA